MGFSFQCLSNKWSDQHANPLLSSTSSRLHVPQSTEGYIFLVVDKTGFYPGSSIQYANMITKDDNILFVIYAVGSPYCALISR
jgi:hypothetical protein